MKHSGLYQAVRQRLVKAPFADCVDMTGKTVLVTGCTPGSLGFATAKALAEWGAKVVITTRTNTSSVVAILQAALPANASITGHELDLTQATSVASFVRWFAAQCDGRLDVLINNAGVHMDLLSQWKEPHLSDDGFEIQWRTNYLGTMQLTHLLLPLLQATAKKSGDARIVNVVSQLHSKGFNAGLFAPYPYNSWVAYGMSKLALVHATFEMQRRFSAEHVQAYCLHPGAVFTGVADKGLAGNPLLQAVRNLMAPLERLTLLTPEEGAQTSLLCASQADLAGGRYFQQCRPRVASAESLYVAVATRLWDETAAWVQVFQ